jgi:hypothetical protein
MSAYKEKLAFRREALLLKVRKDSYCLCRRKSFSSQSSLLNSV